MIFLEKSGFWTTVFKMAQSNYRRGIFKDEPIVCFEQSTPQSLAGKYMLNQYLRRLEIDSNAGIRENDYTAVIKSATDRGVIECFYCKESHNPKNMTFDHFVPYFFGGKNHFSNLRLACSDCNSMKGSIHHETMPVCWELFKRNLQQGNSVMALDILKEAISMELSDEERQLCQKLEQKELEWREERSKIQIAKAVGN